VTQAVPASVQQQAYAGRIAAFEQTLAEVKSLYHARFGEDMDDEEYYRDTSSFIECEAEGAWCTWYAIIAGASTVEA